MESIVDAKDTCTFEDVDNISISDIDGYLYIEGNPDIGSNSDIESNPDIDSNLDIADVVDADSNVDVNKTVSNGSNVNVTGTADSLINVNTVADIADSIDTAVSDVVYLVENEECARRIESAGGRAVSVGAWDEKMFVDFAFAVGDRKRRRVVFATAFSDSYRKAQVVRDILKQYKCRSYIFNIFGYVDSDEAFSDVVQQTKTYDGLMMHALRASSARGHKYRREEEKRLNREEKPVSTGFKQIDDVLMGGLEPGLYAVGGVSSLGKTSLVHQMADQIALQGRDVLYFALEMGETELQDRSISRLTYELSEVTDGDGNRQKGYGAKCYAEIHQTKRYASYTQDELDLIAEAETAYDTYSSHLFFIEGYGDMTVDRVQKIVHLYMQLLKTRPVVVIDYLQLIVPSNDGLNDKQAMDDAVTRLRIMARNYRVPVIAISSYNRSNYNSKANLGALKESGKIEYSADCVIALQLQGTGQEGFDSDEAMASVPRYVEAVFLKARNGAVLKKVRFEYQCAYNHFREITDGEVIKIPGLPDIDTLDSPKKQNHYTSYKMNNGSVNNITARRF